MDAGSQPTQQIIGSCRRAEFITPIPKPRKRKGAAEQLPFLFNEAITYPQMNGNMTLQRSSILFANRSIYGERCRIRMTGM